MAMGCEKLWNWMLFFVRVRNAYNLAREQAYLLHQQQSPTASPSGSAISLERSGSTISLDSLNGSTDGSALTPPASPEHSK